MSIDKRLALLAAAGIRCQCGAYDGPCMRLRAMSMTEEDLVQCAGMAQQRLSSTIDAARAEMLESEGDSKLEFPFEALSAALSMGSMGPMPSGYVVVDMSVGEMSTEPFRMAADALFDFSGLGDCRIHEGDHMDEDGRGMMFPNWLEADPDPFGQIDLIAWPIGGGLPLGAEAEVVTSTLSIIILLE